MGAFDQLHAAGCIQTGADVHSDARAAFVRFGPLFQGLMLATGKDPCNGCPEYKGGLCAAFKQFNTRYSPPRPAAPKQAQQPRERHVPRCRQCGLKRRSPGHDEGEHHKARARS